MCWKTRVPLQLTHKPTWVNSLLVTLDVRVLSGLDWKGSFCSKSYSSVLALQRLCEMGQVEKALDLMDQQSTNPAESMYRSLLKACVKRKALAQARRVSAHLAKLGLDSTSSLGEYAVSTLVQCGGLEYALQVFQGLAKRTAFSWTAIISGYTIRRQDEKALRMWHAMRERGMEPNKYTLVSLLRACGSLRDLQEGKRLHDEVSKYRYERELFVGTSLVDMYGKCGSIVDAQRVFDGLSQRDVVSWTAILSAYVQQDQAENTLELYEQMLEEGVIPNNRTFVIVFQACGLLAEREEDAFVDGQLIKVKSLDKGKAIHADAELKGHDSDLFVASTLVSMYGKCGSIVDAQNVFDALSHHDVVSWTAILAAYAQQGLGDKVLQLYKEMWEEGVSPNARSFVIALQACGLTAQQDEDVVVDGQPVKAMYLGKLKALHADAMRKGCHSDGFVGSTLITMYGKCGSIVDAEHVFQRLTEPSVVTWNAMLVAYAQQSRAKKGFKLYEQMREKDVTPDIRTFVSLLQVCAMLAGKEDDVLIDGRSTRVVCLEKGKVIHADAWRRNYDSDAFVNSTLISLYGRCGSIVDAQHVLQGLCHQNVVSWNAMLAVLVEQSQAEKAFEVYELMLVEGVLVDGWTFANVFQACGMLAAKEQDLVSDRSSRLEYLGKAKTLHACCRRNCYDSDVFVATVLIATYGKCGSTVDAQAVFDGLTHRSVVAWTALLTAYVEDANGRKAFELYRQMQVEGVSPDDITLVCILQSCSNTGDLDICRSIHVSLVATRDSLSVLVANALIHAYGRCGSMVDAQIVFEALPKPNVVSWTTLIAGYARQGDCLASLQSYEDMQVAGVEPNEVTFLSLLSACSHAGLVHKGVEFFDSMSRDHGITPNIEHYVSLVDLLGRAGYFLRVKGLLSTMPLQPNLSMWLCLLSACRMHSNVLLARYAFDQAVHLQPRDCAPYVLMSNIYSHIGLWKSLREVNTLEHEAGAWKTPGQCWIEHDHTVHTFCVGYDNCPRLCDQQRFYNLLGELRFEVDGH